MANTWLLIAIFAVLSCISEGKEKHMICRDVRDDLTSQDNSASEPELDYDRIAAKVAERMSRKLRRIDDELEQMNEMHEQMLRRLNETETIIEVLGFKEKYEKFQNLCKFIYQGKCYFGIFPTFRYASVNYQEGENLCAEHGAKAANIYDSEHYSLLETYLRGEIVSYQPGIAAWLGMKANITTDTYTLSDGEQAPFLKWADDFPRPPLWSTSLAIMIMRNAPSEEGMYNTKPTLKVCHGVVCELQIS